MASNDMMSFVERYQLLYEKDPNSKIFAPLAEAYRRMGLVDEAIDLAERGVQGHPHFASGRVALGKCYVQRGKFGEAAEQLKAATELSPENLLAHQLLAECYSRLKKPAEALSAYKIVLFLNPNDARIAEIVKNLETQIYAPSTEGAAGDVDFEDEEYSMSKPQELKELSAKTDRPEAQEALPESSNPEQELALLDAIYKKGDLEKAKEHLEELELKYPDNPTVAHKKTYLSSITNGDPSRAEFITPQKLDPKAQKIEILKGLMRRIDERRSHSP